MLKRLLIAVFVLGLILALNGTAFSDVAPKSQYPLNPVVKINPTHARVNQVADARPVQPTFKKDAAALAANKLPAWESGAVTAPPLDYFCDDIDYSAGAAYFWTIPDAYGDDLFNNRFTSESNFDCTLKVAWLLMYGTAMTGTPDMRVYLWDDDGFGFPGAKLDSVEILNASLPVAGLGWVGADFGTSPNAPAGGWVFSDGEQYHYGFTTIGGPADTLAIISDDATGPYAGEEISSENFSGTWGSMLNDWGLDVVFNITSELCCGEIPFTDCYTQDYAQNIAYLWRAPHPTYGDEEYSMRFDVGGPETLVSVDVAIYNDGLDFGDDDVIISVYGDAAGLPDEGNLIDQVTLLAGTYSAFPAMTSVPFNTIIDETFHVAFGSSAIFGSGKYEAVLSSNGTDGTGRSASDFGGGTWVDFLTGWGVDVNFLIAANMCRDEYSICQTQMYAASLNYFWRLPDQYGDFANAMRMSGFGQECRIQEVSWALYGTANPNNYTYDSKISVYTDAGGLPGTEIASILLTPADYQFYPALTTVDFTPLDVYVSGDYHVAIESFAPDSGTGIKTLSDNGASATGRGSEYFGIWATMLADWGLDAAFIAYAEHCCVPFSVRACDPGGTTGWATLQGNQARNGASDLAVGDAWCDLNVNWAYEHPSQGITFNGPAIYGDKVVCAFTNQYQVFDITSGALLYTLTSAVGSGVALGSDIRCTPTIVNMDIAAVPTDVMFAAGGSTNGIVAFDFNTGALIWERSISTVGPGGIFGLTRFSAMTVLNDGAMNVLYTSTDNGKVVAIEAETGALYAGWATNPVSLNAGTFISGATDGTSLFYSTQSAATPGDIYSVDAATGTINWQLSATDGLQAGPVTGVTINYPEGFRGGVAYDNGQLYAVSYANDGGANDHPCDGIFYALNAGTGSLYVPAVATNRAQYSTPLVDVNAVFAPTLTQWANPTDPTGGSLIAFNRSTGTQIWGSSNPAGDRYYHNGILTCEVDTPEEVDDLIFIFNEGGFLQCINYDTGEEIFRRRVEHGGGSGEIGFAGALAETDTDGIHMVFTTFWGDLIDLKEGVSRPRLEIQTFAPTTAVEFGVNPALPVNAGPIIVNTGCEDLNIFATYVDENPNPNGSSMPDFAAGYVPEEVMERAAAIADDMARESFLSKFRQLNDRTFNTEGDLLNVRSTETDRYSRTYSAGIPAWFISLDHPTAGDVVAAGDTMDLEFTVNQPLISRGPQSVYIAIESDDVDYFMNYGGSAAGMLPEVLLTAVGGCLIDTTTLHFGVGSANLQLVTNTTRLGTGDWDPHGFDINGEDAAYYQGSLIYGTSKYSIALNTQDWSSGGGEADAWTSIQADPNYCDTECKPALTASVAVGSITADGITYDPMTADMVCATYLDSVENFDTNADPLVTAWDWSAFDIKSFDDTLSMGLIVNSRTYGVVDRPELNDVTLEILDITERNGNPVTDWYIGQITDYDVGSDSATFDQSISAAWALNKPAADRAWGSIKIPFGCGTVGAGQDFDYAPLRSVKQLNGAAALFDIGAYFDSAYIYLSAPSGTYQAPQPSNVSDFEMHTSYAAHDFAGGDTYSIGIANFGEVANDPAVIGDIANMVNKWAGFGRGDVNDDGGINLADIVYLSNSVNGGGAGPIPFAHMGDVNADGAVNAADIAYLINYYFNCGPCPMGDWVI